MRFLLLLMLPLALFGSGCSLPVQAQESQQASEAARPIMPNLVGQDGVAAVISLRDQGIAYRLNTTPNGNPGSVVNQLPKAGQALTEEATVDLIISGDERTLSMIEAAAQPKAPAKEDPNEQAHLDELRSELTSRYTLSQEAINQVELPEIKGLPEGHTRPEPPVITTPDKPEQAEAPDPATQPEQAAPVAPAAAPVMDDAALTGSPTVNLGAWTVTLPGPTGPISHEVQGFAMNGYATKGPNGGMVFASCTNVTTKNGESLPAGMVDQLLLAAPSRYGTAERSGRYTSGQMPAVSSIVNTSQGQHRIITWYGYGQLCDISVPVDEQGRSDQIIEPILTSLHHN